MMLNFAKRGRNRLKYGFSKRSLPSRVWGYQEDASQSQLDDANLVQKVVILLLRAFFTVVNRQVPHNHKILRPRGCQMTVNVKDTHTVIYRQTNADMRAANIKNIVILKQMRFRLGQKGLSRADVIESYIYAEWN